MDIYICHSRAGGNPLRIYRSFVVSQEWILAYTGMTVKLEFATFFHFSRVEEDWNVTRLLFTSPLVGEVGAKRRVRGIKIYS